MCSRTRGWAVIAVWAQRVGKEETNTIVSPSNPETSPPQPYGTRLPSAR